MIAMISRQLAKRSISLALALLALHPELQPATAQDADVPFEQVIIDANPPSKPYYKMVGDINGDSRADIVVGGAKGPLVGYLYPDWKKQPLADGGWDGVNGEIVDLDGDGDQDIVMGGTLWFENPGAKAKSWQSHPIDDQTAHDIEVADLNLDGRLDVVGRDQSAFGKNGNKIFVYHQRGDTWSRQTIDCPHGEGLCLADIDGDGDADIVIGGRWYQNPRQAGGRWVAREYTRAWKEPDAQVKVADINGDSRLDVVLTPAELKGETYQVCWYEAPADSTSADWPQHVVIDSIECVIHSLGVGDIDGDGDADIAIAEMHQGQDPDEVSVLLNKDRGTAWHKQVLSVKGSHDIVLADIDGDDDLDIVGANHSGVHPLELWRNNRVARLGAATTNQAADATAPAAVKTEASSVAEPKQLVLDWLSDPEIVGKFGAISDKIWSYAELGLQEHRSSALLIQTLEDAGFRIEKGLAGMPTCFVAEYGSGKPVIGILAEYDALPMISQKARQYRQDPVVAGAPGHGCGHNLMGAAATAAAIAVKRAMAEHQLEGTIKLFGSPAEEMLVSRPYMIRAGLFDDVDVVINNHTSSQFSTSHGIRGSALYSVIYRFEGKTAHSAGGPWSGRSALDAVEIMNVATNYLREHLHYTHRMHYIVLNGGEAPNVVPDKASVWYFLRNTDQRLPDMYQRVLNCAQGAALATGTKLAEVRVIAAVHQSHENRALAEVMMKNIQLVGMPAWSEADHEFAKMLQGQLGRQPSGMPTRIGRMGGPAAVFTGGASSDHGDVTLIAPTATIRFPGTAPGARGHHWSTVACGFGPGAHQGVNAGAKAMAATAIDLLTRSELMRAIRAEFEAYSKQHPYQSFLPPDAKPPLDINEKLMQQYRPLMQPFYHQP